MTQHLGRRDRPRLAIVAAIGAAAVALVALVVAQLDGDTDIVPFFAALIVAGAALAWLVVDARARWRRVAAVAIVALWLIAAVWIGGLLLVYQASCACSQPPPAAERTYLGLTATVYHLIGLYGGLVLAALAIRPTAR